MINPQWLELSMSRINFHGSKDVPAVEVCPNTYGKYGVFDRLSLHTELSHIAHMLNISYIILHLKRTLGLNAVSEQQLLKSDCASASDLNLRVLSIVVTVFGVL